MYDLMWKQTMKKLNITKEAFEKSKYFTRKYGKLEYVSESGKLFKTNKGKVLKFKESSNTKDEPYSIYKFINTLRWDYNEYMLEEPKILGGIGDGWKEISIMCSKSQYRKMLGVVKKYCQKYDWEYQSHKIDEDVFEIIVSQWDESTLTDDFRESNKKFGKGSIDRGDWMDENLFDLILKLDDVAIKAKTELKDKDLFIKLRGIVNDLTDLRLEGITGRLSKN